MSFKKFEPKDILLNTMKAHPSCEFLIYNGTVYYNNTPQLLGDSYRSPESTDGTGAPKAPASPPTGPWLGLKWTGGQVRNVPPGFISLYEYNIDRALNINNFIYPFIRKDSARASFRTAIASSSAGGWTENEWENAVNSDILYGNYPLSASISRKYITTPSASVSASCKTCGPNFENHGADGMPQGQYDKQFVALKNRLNFYGNRSAHYLVSSSFGDKNIQILNMINIPSIFYGTQIQPGSISLKFYITGSLAGEVRDLKQNGELIQVSGTHQDTAFANDNGGDPLGRVAGVALYDEGIILLTGSWSLDGSGFAFPPAISCSNSSQPGCSDVSWYPDDSARWNNFGAGANDLIQLNNMNASDQAEFVKTSFNMSFRGTTETQVMTMFAHAKRGEVNFSNNPTSIQYGQDQLHFTSSHVYEENKERMLANIVSSSYINYSGSFKRQVYVSRVAIYDEYKNLIGVATLANPVLKEEDQDYTFKLKLDI